MQFDPNEIEHSAVYKLLTGSIIPRPIGWVSSVSEEGINNLAPFSYFNAVGDDPPHVMFSTGIGNNTHKDTLSNILATKQFVVNMVTEELTEQMNITAQSVPADIDEFELAGVTPITSEKVKPMRIKESPINFECELVHHYFLEDHKNGGACVIIGRIVMMHFHDEVLLENYKINMENYRPVSRLAGAGYAKLGEIFNVKRN